MILVGDAVATEEYSLLSSMTPALPMNIGGYKVKVAIFTLNAESLEVAEKIRKLL